MQRRDQLCSLQRACFPASPLCTGSILSKAQRERQTDWAQIWSGRMSTPGKRQAAASGISEDSSQYITKGSCVCLAFTMKWTGKLLLAGSIRLALNTDHTAPEPQNPHSQAAPAFKDWHLGMQRGKEVINLCMGTKVLGAPTLSGLLGSRLFKRKMHLGTSQRLTSHQFEAPLEPCH